MVISLQLKQKYTDTMNDYQPPIFSIVMTTYNRAWCIERAIDSVFAQTESRWELIIVDDGSTDSTAELVRRYVLSSNKVRLIVQSNQGTGAARQAGIRQACGHFVTFLDSDDQYLPEHLAIRRGYICEFPECDFFYGGVLVEGSPVVPDKDNPHRLIPIEQCAVGGTFVIRRTVAATLGFAPLRYADDADFFERAIAAGITPMYVPYPSYRYNRNSPDSLCTALEQAIHGITTQPSKHNVH